ncbi:MAG: hypothetical protein LBU60_04180 [Clostridiales bacterium]|jgi:hypothetical protein|nr:hypothetical protein [Clostridiales bacterium]
MQCHWCKQEKTLTKGNYQMCLECYQAMLSGFTLIESDKSHLSKTSGRFVVIDRQIIRDIVINNKSEVRYTVTLPNGKIEKRHIRTTPLQRMSMKKVFTVDVLKDNKAIISKELFAKFNQSSNTKRVRV